MIRSGPGGPLGVPDSGPGALDTSDNSQVILEEDYDPNWQPTQEEVVEYAEFLGMDIEADADLLWIAKEGLKAPLPSEWKPCKTPQDEICSSLWIYRFRYISHSSELITDYFNFRTGSSQWEHPCDNYYKDLFQVRFLTRLVSLTSLLSLSTTLFSCV